MKIDVNIGGQFDVQVHKFLIKFISTLDQLMVQELEEALIKIIPFLKLWIINEMKYNIFV